jgi:hypothetical protein
MWVPQLERKASGSDQKAGELHRKFRKRGNWKNRDWSFEEKLNTQMKGLR